MVCPLSPISHPWTDNSQSYARLFQSSTTYREHVDRIRLLPIYSPLGLTVLQPIKYFLKMINQIFQQYHPRRSLTLLTLLEQSTILSLYILLSYTTKLLERICLQRCNS